MKKKYQLFILIFFLVSFESYSQSFHLLDSNHSPVNNGDTIVVTGDTTINLLSAPCDLSNSGISGKTVQVLKTNLSVVPGTSGMFDFGSMMYDTSTTLSFGDLVGPGGNIGFNAIYNSFGLTGTSYFNYKFFDQNNNADSISVIIEFKILLPTSIDEAPFGHLDLFPNPNNGNFDLTFSNSLNDVILIEIFDECGRSVLKNKSLNSMDHLHYDISNEPDGNYFLKISKENNDHFQILKEEKY